MDNLSCHAIYVDKRAHLEGFFKRASESGSETSSERGSPSPSNAGGANDIQSSLMVLSAIFNGVHVLKSGKSCMTKLRKLNANSEEDLKPILVFVDTSDDFPTSGKPLVRALTNGSEPSPTSSPTHPRFGQPDAIDPDDRHGLALLQLIVAEISCLNLSRLVIPIALVKCTTPTKDERSRDSQPPGMHSIQIDPRQMITCLDVGAIDVLTCPLQGTRILSLTAHAYRAHKEALRDQAAFLANKRLRKRSWVGVEDSRPYGWLRESMVSTLMTSICKPESIVNPREKRESYTLTQVEEQNVANACGRWDFSAHDFSDDELAYAAFLILQHALKMPELERFRIPADDMKCFLIACRSAYNSFVIYHNFRHVIDVLQATFVFLLQLRVLPAYPYNSEEQNPEPAAKSPIANILKPFDALTLLVSAIGHDVGHPGVNNAFLVALKSPLAQLYNDLSVLEAFHCAAYSQILRRYWNSAFEDTAMRGLLIKSILATDMGVHFKYMSDLGNLQEKVHHYHDTDSWNENVFEEYRVLICGLLIKCADISNVARPFKTAEKWADTLQLEFARQGEMEKDVGIPTTLFGGPPELGNLMKLANSQIGFMNIFARPLFGAVADILPGMEFAVNEIKSNTKIWEAKVSQEKARLEENLLQAQTKDEGTRSPRSGSPDRFQSRSLPELSHPEGLPASGSEPSVPDTMPMSSSMPLPDLEPRPASHESSTHKAHDRKASSNNSRRSSGVVSLGSISPQRGLLGMERRRSSNTLPSQLQLSFANHIQDKETGEGTGSSENSVPSRSRKVSVETIPASNTNETSRKGSWSEPSLGGSPVTSTADRAVDETSFRSHKLPHSRQQHFSRPLSYRHSAHPSSTRHSTISGSQDRNSKSTSGAFTMSSHAVPYSPTDTRATSFFTEGSEKASSIMLTDDEHDTTYTKNGSVASLQNSSAEPEKRIRPKSYLEPPGVNGHVSQDSVASSAPERTVRKKTSRFRFVEFWKGKKKGVE